MPSDLQKTAEDSARNGFFLASGSAIATLILAVGAIVIGRLLGPEIYGQYTLVLVAPQLLFLFTDLGINQGIIKFIAKLRVEGETKKVPNIIYCGLSLRISIGIALFAALYFFAEPFSVFLLNRADLAPYLQIMSVMILFQAIYSTASSAFLSLDKSEYGAFIATLDAIIKSSVSITLVLIGFNLAGALAGNVVGFVIAGICGVVILWVVLPKERLHLSSSTFRRHANQLVTYGMPLYVSFLLTGLIPLYQNVMLANFGTDTDVGNFKAASNFATLMTVLSIPITNALLSAFSKLDSAEDKKIGVFFKMANKYTTLVIFPITVLFIFFSNEIIQLVYGSTYQTAGLFLALSCLVYFLVGLGYLNLSSFFNGLGATKITMKICLITFLLVAILSPLLAFAYGVVGLIGALLVANVLGISYGAYVARKRYMMQFDRSATTKILLISAVSAAPLLLLRYVAMPIYATVALGVLVYLVVYLTLIPLTKTVGASEFQMVGSVLKKIRFLKLIGHLMIKYELKLCRMHSLVKDRLAAPSKD